MHPLYHSVASHNTINTNLVVMETKSPVMMTDTPKQLILYKPGSYDQIIVTTLVKEKPK